MMKKQQNSGLIFAMIFSATLITGGLVFFGLQLRNNPGATNADVTNEQIEAGIEAYIAKQEAEAAKVRAEASKPKFVEGDFADDDPVLGDKNAPVTMIEFSDYECPFCKRHFTQTLPLLKEKYIDTGKLKLVFRDFPLGFHNPLATEQAMAAECVREQKGDETYFAYHDLLFETTNSNGRGMTKEQLYDLAEQVGANRASFTECLDNERYKDEIAKDLADGQSAGITGTPGFLINGQLVSGAQPYAVFESIIEAELKK